MAEGRQEAEWGRTAELLALIYNVNRPAKTKAIQSWRLNPFGKRPTARPAARVPHNEAWTIFKTAFDRGSFGGNRR